ncbi:hypothetical protein [Marilutibacter chinensis]|uniref:Uncharacterized protein n=1 Tax=Marilutibacter chinensis TaxID=2912247 RepID=A0ABS9HUX5_9GAMM|nr:hypothetical protein [Lysobacter chinensis]MCF7222493.1 hypothetical protein [Lysobacter chinensis]
MTLSEEFSDLASRDFHDAEIIAIHFDLRARRCNIELALPKEMDRERLPFALELTGLSAATCALDINEIVDNAKTGNVMTCRVDEERKIVRLYLTDGFVELRGEGG